MKKTLCDEKTERLSVHVVASLVAGKLSISGQDTGPAVEEHFGGLYDSDYEYFYSFSEANTKRLLESLKPGAELGELLELLAGEMHCNSIKLQPGGNVFASRFKKACTRR